MFSNCRCPNPVRWVNRLMRLTSLNASKQNNADDYTTVALIDPQYLSLSILRGKTSQLERPNPALSSKILGCC